MNKILNIKLTKVQIGALKLILDNIHKIFLIDKIILFGSYSRGNPDDESDIDLLILTQKKLTRFERHKITNLVFDINLEHDTNFSTLVIDSDTWNYGVMQVLPIKREILKEGIPVE